MNGHCIFAFASLGCIAAAGAEPSKCRVYSASQADEARQIAIRECKPLVLHFAPNEVLAAQQLREFYLGEEAVPSEVLDRIVVIVVPSDAFPGFSEDLGVLGAGYRTISPYHLSPLTKSKKPKCSGFK